MIKVLMIAAFLLLLFFLFAYGKQDSSDMIHRPIAAMIKNPGRAYVQVGYDEIFELVQSGYSGADYIPQDVFVNEDDITVRLVNWPGEELRTAKDAAHREKANLTQLEAVMNEIVRLGAEFKIYAMILLVDTRTGQYGACNIVVSEKSVLIDSVRFPKKNRSMEVGDTAALQAEIVPVNASVQKLLWSSSKPSVASVDSTGYVTAHKAGTAVISARAQDGGSANASVEITVKKKKIRVFALNLSAISLSMEEGTSRTLKVQVSPTNATNRKVAWKSSNPSVVSVNQSGKLRAKKTGTAKITVRAKDGSGTKAVCRITVKRKIVYVEKVSLSASRMELKVGKSCTLTAQAKPDRATNRKVHWFSSNPDVASVNGKGVVQAKSEGIAVIRAVAADGSGKQAVCNVSVRGAGAQKPMPSKPTPSNPAPVKRPKIKTPSSYAQEGKTIRLTADIRGGQWSYLKKSGLAYIHTEGNVCKVTGISKGEIVIRYTLNGQSASVNIYVVP